MTSGSDLIAHKVTLYHRLTWARTLSQNFRRAYIRDRAFLEAAIASGVIGSYEEAFRSEMYMCLWLSTLYIVVEGWPKLRERDPAITVLLRSQYKNRLKDFRDAAFHPNNVSDQRFHSLTKDAASLQWAYALTEAFWRYFRPVADADRGRRIRKARPVRLRHDPA